MTKDQEKLLRDVHQAVIGNPKLGQEGVIPRLKKLEDYKVKDQAYKNRVAGGIAVGTVAAGGIWRFIVDHLFK